jgi:hypothetical protein
MSPRETVATGALLFATVVAFGVGLVASSDLAMASAVAAATLAVGLLAAVVALLRRLGASVRRQEELAQARLDSERGLARTTRTQGARIQKRLDSLAAAVTTLQADVASLQAPSAATLTGDDLTSRGARVLEQLQFDGESPSVVLVLQSFGSDVLFAGIRTAALAAAELAGALGRPLRVVVFEDVHGDLAELGESLAAMIRSESRRPQVADDVRISVQGARRPRGHHPDDVWVATFWTTAWNLARLAEDGRVRPENVVYFVQDWEPSFYPWGELQLKARSTYSAGFRLLVNSRSLALYVEQQTGRPVDPGSVFAPELDPTPLHAAADRWKPAADGSLRVLFYARPAKPRNMANLGVRALRAWAESLPEVADVVVRLAGEPIGEVDLGPRLRAEPRGKLSYDAYYDLLAETDLGLALMSSPHPGHLALELPMAGIPTVTNPFEGCREPWVDGLVVAERADDRALADALATAARTAVGLTSHARTTLSHDLGRSLADAVAVVARDLLER